MQRAGSVELRLFSPVFPRDIVLPAGSGPLPEAVLLGIRPNDVRFVVEDTADFVATTDLVQFLGGEQMVSLKSSEENSPIALAAVLSGDQRVALGDRLGLYFPRDRLHYFDAATGRALSNSPKITLAKAVAHDRRASEGVPRWRVGLRSLNFATH